ncbi:hypothetical protein FB45DRAFT_950397 [Roridomyces roridus]|uniref:Uncharacterized protein n=1 Tax=Roridomyces roridus TaxID=1738132 RepID=A0AAD7B0K4_9AGAR|nr:hypothetical protein FB45DRAFT_950397 [Roridomyces roridus]
MTALERVETRGSLASWWSDSNPLLRDGPTINIHALAKPLMKRMYHRQALAFIAKDVPGEPLSKGMVEIYTSYLSCKYVFPETRLRVLEHLASSIPDNAQEEFLCSSAVELLPQMLPDDTLKWGALSLVEGILARKLGFANSVTIRNIDTRNWYLDDVEMVKSVLVAMSENAEGAGVVSALLDESKTSGVREWACALVEQLGGQLSFDDVGLHDFPLVRIFKNARDHDAVFSKAIAALFQVAQQEKAETGIRTSRDFFMPKGALTLMFALLERGLSVDSILRQVSLTRLFDHLHPETRETKTRVLCVLGQHPSGAAAIVAAERLKEIADLLLSDDVDTKHRVCALLESLVRYEPLKTAHLWEFVVGEMLDVPSPWSERERDRMRWQGGAGQAISALIAIAKHEGGAHVLASTYATRSVLIFLTEHQFNAKAYKLIETLVENGLSPDSLLGSELVRQLGHLIRRHKDERKGGSAAYMLSALVRGADFAASVLEASIPGSMQILLRSRNENDRYRACCFISTLAEHRFTVPGILRQIPIQILTDLVRREDPIPLMCLNGCPPVGSSATVALTAISRHPKGAETLVGTNILHYLLSSPWQLGLEECDFIATLARGEHRVDSTISAPMAEKILLAFFYHKFDSAPQLMEAVRQLSQWPQARMAFQQAIAKDSVLSRFEGVERSALLNEILVVIEHSIPS